jgi:hypothetical protein
MMHQKEGRECQTIQIAFRTRALRYLSGSNRYTLEPVSQFHYGVSTAFAAPSPAESVPIAA